MTGYVSINESSPEQNYMQDKANLTRITAEMVSAFLSNNQVMAQDIPALIRSVHQTVSELQSGVMDLPLSSVTTAKPAVPVKRSVTDEYIVCLEDGLKFKSLKRHLRSSYGLTPEQYRAKWGLPHDYPMVAPKYAEHRSRLAKAIGLGRKRGAKRR
jgi:predicted transcriptional regulator